MKTKSLLTVVKMVFFICATNLSCTKVDWHNYPAYSNYDVAEYHIPIYDNDINSGEPAVTFPVLFKKTYDASGLSVNEIDCSFNNLNGPLGFTHYQLLVRQAGSKLAILDKNTNDTVMTAVFNSNGRVQSCRTTFAQSSDNLYLYATNYFNYKNNRLFSTNFNAEYGEEYNYRIVSYIDTFRYDNYGNLLSNTFNSYQYDYTKKAARQFYADGFAEFNNGFYLLQYLGFFNELTNPPNVRILLKNSGYGERTLFDHKFDAKGNLISYRWFTDTVNYGPATIKWHYPQ